LKKSAFQSDLEKEKRLAPFLDELYTKHLKYYSFRREANIVKQREGIDLVFTHKGTKETYFVDEKAQLDYLNEDLPTFAFELLYQKREILRKGWLFDTRKKTQFYALVTGIYSDAPNTYTSAKITMVNRQLLLHRLVQLGVSEQKVALPNNHGKQVLPQLNPDEEGYLFLSKKNKAEQPLNLVLRLDFLFMMGVAKRLV